MLTRLLSSPPPFLAPEPKRAFFARWAWWLGWCALAVLLLVAVPLHLRMPLFADVIQYDISARVALKGGIPYRDVFDTNLPGMVWVHMAVRSLLGWSPEAFRLADLAVVLAIILLLVGWLRLLGRPAATQVWAAVLLYAFYFSTPNGSTASATPGCCCRAWSPLNYGGGKWSGCSRRPRRPGRWREAPSWKGCSGASASGSNRSSPCPPSCAGCWAASWCGAPTPAAPGKASASTQPACSAAAWWPVRWACCGWCNREGGRGNGRP